MIQTIARQYGVHYTDDEVAALSFEEKSNWLKCNHMHIVSYGLNMLQSLAKIITMLCDFIDQYVSCKVPAEDGKLKDLVLLLQKHKHSSYCRRNKTCRFSFPEPPSSKTLITNDNPERGDSNQELAVLGKVQKLIADGYTYLNLAELLDKAEVTEKNYIDALVAVL